MGAGVGIGVGSGVCDVGDRVGARFRGRSINAWFPGVVAARHPDGTYDVDYDDGDRDERLGAQHVRTDVGNFGKAPPRADAGRAARSTRAHKKRRSLAIGVSLLSTGRYGRHQLGSIH